MNAGNTRRYAPEDGVSARNQRQGMGNRPQSHTGQRPGNHEAAGIPAYPHATARLERI